MCKKLSENIFWWKDKTKERTDPEKIAIKKNYQFFTGGNCVLEIVKKIDREIKI